MNISIQSPIVEESFKINFLNKLSNKDTNQLILDIIVNCKKDLLDNKVSSKYYNQLLYIYHNKIINLIDKYILYLPNYINRDDIYMQLSNSLFSHVKRFNIEKSNGNYFLFIYCCIEKQLYDIIHFLKAKKRYSTNTNVSSIDGEIDQDCIAGIESTINVVKDIITEEYIKELLLVVDTMIDDYLHNFAYKSNGVKKNGFQLQSIETIKYIILNYYKEGKSYEEIYSTIGWNKKQVDNALQSFRDYLRQKKKEGKYQFNFEVIN